MAGTPRGPQYSGEERVEMLQDVRRIYEQGFSIRQIAAMYSRSYSWAHRMVLESGVTLRPKGNPWPKRIGEG
jgi:transposase